MKHSVGMAFNVSQHILVRQFEGDVKWNLHILIWIQWNIPLTNRAYFKHDVCRASTLGTCPAPDGTASIGNNPQSRVACSVGFVSVCDRLVSAGKRGQHVDAICNRKFSLDYI